jgi:hypothetical protein
MNDMGWTGLAVSLNLEGIQNYVKRRIDDPMKWKMFTAIEWNLNCGLQSAEVLHKGLG